MILEDDTFATIVNAVEEGRSIYDNIRKFVRYMLSANFDEIFVITAAVLMGMPLPFLPIQILWINLLTDGLPSLALGFDSKDKNIMKRKPRDPSEGILNGMLPFIIGSGILAALISFGLFYFEIKNGSTLERARTLVFTTAVVFELIFVFNCRSERDPVWRTRIFSNKFLLVAFVVGVMLQLAIIYVPFLNAVFKTVPLNISDWLIIGLLSSTGLFILPKFAIRSK